MGLGLKLIHISLRKLAERLVSWCFEPSQPQRITPGLNTDFNLSPGYSLHESLYGTYHQVIHFTSHCTALVIRLFISQVIVRHLSPGYSFHKSLYGTRRTIKVPLYSERNGNGAILQIRTDLYALHATAKVWSRSHSLTVLANWPNLVNLPPFPFVAAASVCWSWWYIAHTAGKRSTFTGFTARSRDAGL